MSAAEGGRRDGGKAPHHRKQSLKAPTPARSGRPALCCSAPCLAIRKKRFLLENPLACAYSPSRAAPPAAGAGCTAACAHAAGGLHGQLGGLAASRPCMFAVGCEGRRAQAPGLVQAGRVQVGAGAGMHLKGGRGERAPRRGWSKAPKGAVLCRLALQVAMAPKSLCRLQAPMPHARTRLLACHGRSGACGGVF